MKDNVPFKNVWPCSGFFKKICFENFLDRMYLFLDLYEKDSLKENVEVENKNLEIVLYVFFLLTYKKKRYTKGFLGCQKVFIF